MCLSFVPPASELLSVLSWNTSSCTDLESWSAKTPCFPNFKYLFKEKISEPAEKYNMLCSSS